MTVIAVAASLLSSVPASLFSMCCSVKASFAFSMCCSVKASFGASSPCTSTSTTLVSRASSTPTDPMLGEALVSDLDSCSSGMVERPLASLTNLN